MNRPKAYKVITCRGCRRTKRIYLAQGHAAPEVVKHFESDGWMYKDKSSGICPDCNLFNQKGQDP